MTSQKNGNTVYLLRMRLGADIAHKNVCDMEDVDFFSIVNGQLYDFNLNDNDPNNKKVDKEYAKVVVGDNLLEMGG